MRALKHTIWAELKLSEGKHHRDKEQVGKNSHVCQKTAVKKSFRCFEAVKQTEELNSSLLTEMYHQYKATLP